MTVIQPNVTLHDAHGHLWRTAPDFQDREPSAPGWLLLRSADGIEMPYARVLDLYGYGSPEKRYLLGRYDQAAADLHARLAAERPIPAVGLRQQVPAHYLRILHEWAEQIAEYQASIGNHPTSDKALWMRAVTNPDWQDGRCEGLTDAQAHSWRVMWAECGRTDMHEGHDQPQEDLPPEQFEEIRSAIQQAVRDGDQP